MQVSEISLHESLQTHFGFDQFKGNQESIIRSVLSGNDTFVLMPTGGGKSLCYQLPALIMPGTAIIISPLIALMKNQVDALRGYSESDHVAHFLNSSLTKKQINEVKEDISNGKTKLLYVAPETLTKDENIQFFQNVSISLIAVDEAHCISEWGHDFRPEYRRIREMIDAIGDNTPVIALTATATPKVRSDIIKNLDMLEVKTFVSSFNRENLYYELRPKLNKAQTIKQIVQFISEHKNESGIIYAQARKTTEELAEALSVNGIKAAPYHAGLEAKVRANVQDAFLMEDIDVICATIAFGMGIDKPDVRFVIHFDIPKSIENYYQETGRAGRDGMEGHCLAFYSYKDILILEKFLRDKTAAEREMGSQLLNEVIAYAETATCRRKFLLHYFGEHFAEQDCDAMCDNCRHPKEKVEVKTDMVKALQAILELNENYGVKLLVDFITGKETQEIKNFRFDEKQYFGAGKTNDEAYWHSIFRHGLLQDLLLKDIENYGLLKLTDAGRSFIKHPVSLKIPINHVYSDADHQEHESSPRSAALDTALVQMLKDLRKSLAKSKNVPPYVIFQDPSLEDMATQYPITMDDMSKIQGVSLGKAQRFGKSFIELIQRYVEENDIERPTDFVVKQVANKSKSKVAIIQGIDRKLPLEDIASSNQLSIEELYRELDAIVSSGTKLDLDYYLEENLDEYNIETIYDYFMESVNDSVDEAYSELQDDDITLEEIQLVRLKFLSEMAN